MLQINEKRIIKKVTEGVEKYYRFERMLYNFGFEEIRLNAIQDIGKRGDHSATDPSESWGSVGVISPALQKFLDPSPLEGQENSNPQIENTVPPSHSDISHSSPIATPCPFCGKIHSQINNMFFGLDVRYGFLETSKIFGRTFNNIPLSVMVNLQNAIPTTLQTQSIEDRMDIMLNIMYDYCENDKNATSSERSIVARAGWMLEKIRSNYIILLKIDNCICGNLDNEVGKLKKDLEEKKKREKYVEIERLHNAYAEQIAEMEEKIRFFRNTWKELLWGN